MTVTYTNFVANSHLGTFFKLLFHWKGSVYKALWKELGIFLVLYTILSVIYRFLLVGDQKEFFEKVSQWCHRYTQNIPLTFVLGFYVAVVFGRWWQQFTTIAWPDRLALYISTYVKGDDEEGKILRRTMVRYLNLCSVLGLRQNSSAAMKRFPTMDHLIASGFLTQSDLEHLEDVSFPMAKFWVPCHWVATLLHRARAENRIDSDFVLLELLKEVGSFVFNVRMLTYYDWISVPLIYTQVVTLAVYSWAMAALMGRQYLDAAVGKSFSQQDDFIFPLFTVFEFFFYMGWLKVAEGAINPFGEDDDDFETNFIIDRNLKISYAYVDHNCRKVPPLQKDLYFGLDDFIIPHTVASWQTRTRGMQTSTKTMKLPKKLAELVVKARISQDNNNDNDLNSVADDDSPASKRRSPAIFRKHSGGANRKISKNSFCSIPSSTVDVESEGLVKVEIISTNNDNSTSTERTNNSTNNNSRNNNGSIASNNIDDASEPNLWQVKKPSRTIPPPCSRLAVPMGKSVGSHAPIRHTIPERNEVVPTVAAPETSGSGNEQRNMKQLAERTKLTRYPSVDENPTSNDGSAVPAPVHVYAR